MVRAVTFLLGLAASLCVTQAATRRYALILEDPPVVERYRSGSGLQMAAAGNYRNHIEVRQQALRRELAARRFTVTGSVSDLLNAVFVAAPAARAEELANLPGVLGVATVRWRHADLNKAVPLMNALPAWTLLGGAQNAGAGVKIAILDTGIDQTHPAFQDPTLPVPAGYPLCSGADCQFTNNKVIVARSYVRQLAAGSDPNNPAADSRPDDYSPRDRVGHGTAVASCAAGLANTGLVTISGVAPKAYLGNYRIMGSPQVNDGSTDDVIISAIEDAVRDRMDILNLSVGSPAFTGALDTGSACGNKAGVPCDVLAAALENAAKAGTIVVTAAGNSGEDGTRYPTYGSISSPAHAPSVITVGSTTNAHVFSPVLRVPGSGVPDSLKTLTVTTGDAYVPIGAVTAPLRDVTVLGDNGLACNKFPVGSLSGTIALIQRGTCTFSTKLSNAWDAGALGVVFYMADASTMVSPGGLSSLSLPAVMISNADGVALKNYVAAHAGQKVTIDPAGVEASASYNELAGFSSFGPSTGDLLIKPELVATGTDLYMAAASFDPLGALYSATGYALAQGTSFSAPLVAGAAALVKQKHPNFTAAQVKSALVNTAAADVTADDSGYAVDVRGVGAGKLDVAAAINATVTVVPSTLSFGALTAGGIPATKSLRVTNTGASAVTLAVTVTPATQVSAVSVGVDTPNLTLAAGASATLNVALTGTLPAAGAYSGAITLKSAEVSLRVPYLFLVGSGIAANIIPLAGDNFDGTVGQKTADGVIAFRLVDAYGLPVANAPVTFTARGGGSITEADAATDAYGVAGAVPILGPTAGAQSFTAVAGGLRYTFSGYAYPEPRITSVADAASLETGKSVAPGSYISIFGSGLSDYTEMAPGPDLPMAVNYVTVSFDVPSAKISVPGRVYYVSDKQVNVVVPWELQGQSTAQMKVTRYYSPSNVVSVALADVAPSLFEAGAGVAAALDASNALVSTANPARRGQTVQLFANGLGPVSNQPASGDVASSTNLARTTNTPTVTIGGQPATVTFSGLAPGLVGLYQLNVTVPPGIATGTQPVTLSIGGKTAKASSIPVQ